MGGGGIELKALVQVSPTHVMGQAKTEYGLPSGSVCSSYMSRLLLSADSWYLWILDIYDIPLNFLGIYESLSMSLRSL